MKEWGGWAMRNWSWKSRYLILTWQLSTQSGCGTSGNRRRRRQYFRCGAPLLAALSGRPALGNRLCRYSMESLFILRRRADSRGELPLVKGWVDYLTSISEGHLIRFSKYGDWCPPNKFRSLDTPGELISSWCYYHDALTLSKIAGFWENPTMRKNMPNCLKRLKKHLTGSFWKKITTLIILKLLIACCISIFARVR